MTPENDPGRFSDLTNTDAVEVQRLLDAHDNAFGLEPDAGISTQVWHALLSLRQFCRYHSINPDQVWAEVKQYEVETDHA